jgi:hypothetical protein
MCNAWFNRRFPRRSSDAAHAVLTMLRIEDSRAISR